ncbi:MAG: M24 family metallopeptidase, partial [Halobacteriales archaeon]|nr:M24 family metallopeptidase [Halobacteriales archaeon]
AAYESLKAALYFIYKGVNVGKIGEVIESKIDRMGYNSIINLSGHGVGEYDAHIGPNIPNCAIETGVELEIGDVVAIEPFATEGGGKVTEGGKEEIFSLIQRRSIRGRRSRELVALIEDRYKTLPFAARWVEESQGKIVLQRLKMARIIRGYPVLREQKNKLVSQAEHTVIVTKNGCEIITE